MTDEKNSMVRFTNSMFFSFNNNQYISSIIGAKGLQSEDKQKLFRLSRQISESPEFKAYQDMMKEAIDDFEKEQEDQEVKQQMFITHPKIAEIHALDSGFEVEKVCLLMEIVPDEISAADMLQASWIIEFINV